MNASTSINLALIQMQCSDSFSDNLKKLIQKIREAAQLGAQIISMSELALSPYFCQVNDDQFFKLAHPLPDATTDVFAQLAKELGVVLIGSFFERDQTDYYNTALVFDADGSVVLKYRKVHIPDDLPNHYSELYYFKPGNLGIKPVQTRFGKIGVLICWDQWYPEAARSLALQGAQIIFYPTAIGWQVTQKNLDVGRKELDAWITIQRSHAIANGVFVAPVNRIGLENHIDFWGSSFVADPYGHIIESAKPHEEKTLIVPVDLNSIADFRKDWPFLTCRRVDAYTL